MSMGYSCSKDKQITETDVEIFSPLLNELLFLPDTIMVEFSASQNKPIEYIRISIDNGNHVPLTKHIFINPTNNTYTGKIDLLMDKLSEVTTLPPYYIHIVVGDFSDVRHYYHEIKLQNNELKYTGFVTIEEKPINLVEIKFHNTDYERYSLSELSGIYSGSAKSDFSEQIYISTQVPELVTAIDIHTGEQLWHKEPQLPYPEFTGLYSGDNKLYLSTAIGRIIGLSENEGSTIFTTPVLKDTIPRNIISTENYVFADFTLRTSNKKVWTSFYKPTGIKFLWYPTDYNTIKIFPQIGNKAIIFTNKDGLGRIILFDIESNIIKDLITIDNHKIDNVCELESGQFLITDKTSIYSFNLLHQTDSWVYETTDSIRDIDFEEKTGSIFIATSNKVEVVGYPNYSNIKDLSGFNNLKSIELLYTD